MARAASHGEQDRPTSRTPNDVLPKPLRASPPPRFTYLTGVMPPFMETRRDPPGHSPRRLRGGRGRRYVDTLVLTEDDCFDDLIGTSAGKKRIFKVIESALVNNSLLSLGFNLTDWTFRALFRLRMSLKGRELLKNYGHIAVQLDPEMQQMQDIDGAKGYPAEYFGQELNIDVYSGSAEPFLINLRDELARAVETTQTKLPPPPRPRCASSSGLASPGEGREQGWVWRAWVIRSAPRGPPAARTGSVTVNRPRRTARPPARGRHRGRLVHPSWRPRGRGRRGAGAAPVTAA